MIEIEMDFKLLFFFYLGKLSGHIKVSKLHFSHDSHLGY